MTEIINTHVRHESGDRLVISRETTTEHNVINHHRDHAVWPADEPSQRMWALSAAMQAKGGLKFRDEDLDFAFVEAQQILDWINGK